MDNLKEMLERQVAEKIFTSLYVKYYQDSEHQDIEKLVNDAINAAIIFSQKYIQKTTKCRQGQDHCFFVD